jgi:class 3 adenylate cyclase/CHASE2 domain-containing sensor protein
MSNRFVYLLIGLAAASLLVLVSVFTVLLDGAEYAVRDGFFGLRAPVNGGQVSVNPRLDPSVLIVGIDEASLTAIGPWPFPRVVHARLIEHIVRGAPKSIFFDVIFTEPELLVEDVGVEDGRITIVTAGDSGGDGFLEQAVSGARDAGVPVLFGYPADIKPMAGTADMIEGREPIPGEYLGRWRLANDDPGVHLTSFNFVKLPLLRFLDAGVLPGYIAMTADGDGTYRRIPPAARIGEGTAPHAVFAMICESVGLWEHRIFPANGGSTLSPLGIPVDHRGRMYIDFAGGPGEYLRNGQYLSYSDALRVDPAVYRDAFVLVGPYAQGVSHDIWQSPFGPMFGIEFNAAALNTLIRQTYFRDSAWWIRIICIAVMAVGAACAVMLRRIGHSAAVFLVLLVAWPILTYLAFLSYRLIPTAAPLTAALVAFIAAATYKILVEERESRYIRNRFSNYVSKEVVDEILRNPKLLALGGDDREMTVFFSDIRGFTTLSEALGEPSRVIEILNMYLSSMTRIIIEHGGTLDKYVGDEIMAFWNAPVGRDDHALAACRAACVQMKYLWWVLHPRLITRGFPRVEIGCGINSGMMTVGNMGSEARMDYTVIGDQVNLGARLEGVNKEYGTRILISESTYRQVQDRVMVRELDQLKVKGKEEPVTVFELLCVLGEEQETWYFKPEQLHRWEHAWIHKLTRSNMLPEREAPEQALPASRKSPDRVGLSTVRREAWADLPEEIRTYAKSSVDRDRDIEDDVGTVLDAGG